jgi:hypothetical protein
VKALAVHTEMAAQWHRQIRLSLQSYTDRAVIQLNEANLQIPELVRHFLYRAIKYARLDLLVGFAARFLFLLP